MKLTVLMDNNTYIDQYYYGEPAVSYYLEEEGKRFLFDAGYSDMFLQNAKALGINCSNLDALILSHGHNDHTGGMASLLNRFPPKRVIAHPEVFAPKRLNQFDIGALETPEQFPPEVAWTPSQKPIRITEKLWFLGEIPRSVSFENKEAIGETLTDNRWKPDYLADDSALVYDSEDGFYLITGCSHAGVCNMISYGKEITGKQRVLGIIGGFHLMSGASRQTKETVKYLAQEKVRDLYPCHCTCLGAKIELAKHLPVHEVGVGCVLDWT